MYSTIPLFKSHYSLGKSILTLEKPFESKGGSVRTEYTNSIFDLLKENKLDTLVLVDDNISGLLQASKQCDESKIKLIFGIRLDVTEDMTQKDDASWNRRAKYIIFAKNSQGYLGLLNIWSKAASEGFYYTPCIDFKTLKSLWNDNLTLAVPFYDSFLYMNTFCSSIHVPQAESFKPVFFVEDNDLPFDDQLTKRVKEYCAGKYEILPAQSIFYKSEDDFEAYVAFRCIHNRGTNQKSTLDKPELDHMGSNQFNFDKWLKERRGV